MFQNVGVYGFTQQQLAVAAWLVAVDIGQACGIEYGANVLVLELD